MVNIPLLNIDPIGLKLKSALIFSSYAFDGHINSVDFWATTELKRNIEKQMQSWAGDLNLNNSCCGGSIGGNGFGITLGIQVNVSYNVRFKANLNLGYGLRSGNFAGTSSLHLSVYNGGLGSSPGSKNLVVDITAAVNIVIGTGYGQPLQSYSLNHDSPIPMLNNFKNSISFGQLFTRSSSLNENQFSINDLQREGMIGFRIGDVNVSSNNDTKRFYQGGGTDMGWTGGLSIVTPFMEVGFQDFTGDYFRNGRTVETNDEKRKDENLINNIDSSLGFHHQTPYQKSLNIAATYIRVNRNGSSITLEVIGDAWLQNIIHRVIKDLRFEYKQKRIGVCFGRNWQY